MKDLLIWCFTWVDFMDLKRNVKNAVDCDNISDQLNILRDQILTTNERLLEFMNIVNDQIYFKRSISTDVTLQSDSFGDIDHSLWRPWSLDHI